MWTVITLLIFFLYLLPLLACRRIIKHDHLKTGSPITSLELFATITPIANILVCIMWWVTFDGDGNSLIYAFFGVKKK